MGGGGKKGGSVTVGYRYYMSLLMGVCRGPVDEIIQINVGDLRAWPIAEGEQQETFSIPGLPWEWPVGENYTKDLMYIAEGPDPTYGIARFADGRVEEVDASTINTMRATGDTNISAAELFGGDKKEGGIKGSLRVMMGLKDQVVPSWIKELIGGRVPAFRGVVTLFYDGLLTSLNPYPKSWDVRVRRTVSGWDGDVWEPNLATIWMANNTIKGMNGAHIIYECLTNRDWGRGYSREMLNAPAFKAVAQVLHDEGFGLCLRWNRQGSVGEFISMVIDHIGGSMYVDREAGLITLALLRDDYDPEEVPLFTKSSGLLSVEEPELAMQEDIINEVIVSWQDPINNEGRQSRQQNIASIQAFGGEINSATNAYDGVPTADLALRLTQRDLRASATSLRRFKVRLDRRAWKIVPGQVFRISDPEQDIYNVVLRAGKVEDGSLTDGVITVEAVIDVFGLPSSSFVAAPEQTWFPPNRMPVIPSRRLLREATWRDLVRSLNRADLATVEPDTGTIAVMAAKPTDLSLSFDLATAADGEEIEINGSGSFSPCGDTVDPVAPGDTVIDIENVRDIGLIEIGMEVNIGDEIMRLDDISGAGTSATITVARGCVDTFPQSHTAGEPMFFLDNHGGTDEREYMVGEDVDVKVLSVTSANRLDIDLAELDEITIEARQNMPWAPGKVLVNGAPFHSGAEVAGDALITWAHRNRLEIADQLVEHDGDSTSVEPGLQYNLRIYDELGNLVRTQNGISGTSFNYTSVMMGEDGITEYFTVQLESVRGAYTSHSVYDFTVNVIPIGYGVAYGQRYGK